MQNKKQYSKIIAGTMTWGNWGKNFTTQEMCSLMYYCLDEGITTFDHADIYGGYSTEATFGKAFKESKVVRDEVQLITKCGIQMVDDSRSNKVKHYNFSKEYIVWSAEQSLKNLKTDYLDLFLLHRPSPLMHPETIAEAISKLLHDGKIRSFGVSNFNPSQIALLETAIPVSGNQVEFSLTANEVMYDGSLDDCLAKKRMAMSWSPLGSYFREDNVQVKRIQKAIAPMLSKYNANADQLLLAWILKHPSDIYPVVGTASKERLKASMEATQIDLELEDWFILLEASKGHEVP
ncbi:aldo/keto reductase [Maribacter algarum]|uniref:Aldo/keto reductase n=1 Tax=Maribacter algarum (ex Zhang et al. 2020) TaxID=2578118 RepID=A0A5S3PVX8_9FLAO|nr:aldo/keto reductase [Maribacter algarum]TMM59176.1 aldo/keto reductase [Maribacter algarum]